MADIATLGFAIDSSQATTAARNLDGMDAAARRAETGTSKMARQVERDISAVQRTLGQLGAGLAAFFSVQAITSFARSLSGLADKWSDLTSRVQIAIGANGDAAAVMDRLSIVARQTYSSLEKTADGFARNATTLNALGKSTQQQLDYTQALNNALVVSGAKGQQAELVMNGLSRSMAEGAMKGDDLNLILNYGSRIAEVLAKELGTTTLGLRDMAKDGKITGDVIFNSLVKNMDLLTKQAESMPATIGDAFTLISNAALRTVGAFDKQNKLSQNFAEKLIVLADHMDEIFRAATLLAQVLATLFAAKLLYSAAAFTVELGLQAALYLKNITLAGLWGAANQQGILASIKSIGALKLLIGGAAAAMVGWQIGTYLREEFRIVADAGDYLVYGIAQGWEELKRVTGTLWAGIKYIAIGAIDGITEAFALMLRQIASASNVEVFGTKLLGSAPEQINALADAVSGALTPLEDFQAEFAGLTAEYKKNSAANDAMLADMQAATSATFDAKESTQALTGAVGGLGTGTDIVTDKVAKATKAVKENDDALEEWLRIMDSITGGNADLAEQLEQGRDRIAGLDDATVRYNAALRETNRLQEEAMALGPMTDEQQRKLTEALAERKRLLREQHNQDYAISEMDRLRDAAERAADDSARAWENFTGDLAQAIAGGSKGIKQWWKSLIDDMKAQLIQSGLLKLFGSIFNTNGAMVSGGGFNLGSLAGLFGGGGTSAPLGSSANASSGMSFSNLASMGATIWKGFSGAASAFSGTGGLFSMTNWATAGKSLFSGFSGGFGNLFGTSANFSNVVGGVNSTAPTIGAANTGTAGAAGTAAYGAGAIAIAVIINSMFEKQGWHIENGMNNTAVNRLALSGIPIVDVSALAQYGVQFADGFLQKLGLDKTWASMLSGSSITSRIFGNQDPKVQRQGMALAFGDAGASGNLYADWKAKGGWFSSSKYGTQKQPLEAEMAEAITAFWDSVKLAMEGSAKTLGVEVPATVAASFKSVYDKAGKLISETGTILGKAYTETFEKFQQRVAAENLIAVVGQSASDASAIAERWRASAALLAEGAQFLLQAQTDIVNGRGLLLDPASDAMGGGLAEVTALIEDLQLAGETLGQTYARAVASTHLWETALRLMGVSMGQSREELVRYSVALQEAAAGQGFDIGELLADFENRFYTAAERAAMAFDMAMESATSMFARNGLDLSNFTGEGGGQAFRDLFESTLPTLSADATVQWLRMANALGIVIDTSAALTAALGSTSTVIARTAEQIQTVADILAGNDAALARLGMSDAQKAIADLGAQYDAQRVTLLANAATAKELWHLEEQRGRSMRQLYDDFVGQFRQLPDANTLAGQIEVIRQAEAAQIEAANTYAIGAGMEGAAAEDLANIHRTAAEQIAAAQAQFTASYRQFIDGFRPDTALPTGADAGSLGDAWAQASVWVQAQIDIANQLAAAAGMSGASAEDLVVIWNAAHAAIATTQARLRDAYDQFVAQFHDAAQLATGADANSLADAWNQAATWVQAQLAMADQLAIAAGMSGASAGDIEAIWARAHAAIATVQARMLDSYNQFVSQFRPDAIVLPTGVTVGNMGDAYGEIAVYVQAQLDMAHQLAIAAGLSGAAIEDILNIYATGDALIAAASARLRGAYDAFVAQFRPAATALPMGDGASTVGGAWEQAAAWVQAQIAAANALAIAAGMAGANAEDLVNIWNQAHTAIAATQARLLASYNSFIDQFRPVTTLPTGADATTMEQAWQEAAAWVQSMIDQANALAIAAGLAGASEADMLLIWNQAHAAIALAQDRLAAQALQAQQAAQQAATDYDALAASIRNMGVTLTEYQQQIQDAEGWYASTVDELNRLAIAAGRTGAATEDLINAELELDRRRALAMQHLMDQTQKLVTSLYGTNLSRAIDALKAKLEGRDGYVDVGYGTAIDIGYAEQQRQLAAMEAQQAAAQARLERMMGVNELVGNLGQLLNIPGQSLEELAKQFELPLDMLAGDLGISQDALETYIREQAEQARGILTVNDTIKMSNDYLRDILASVRGDVVMPSLSSREDVTARTRSAIVDVLEPEARKRDESAKRADERGGRMEVLTEKLLDKLGLIADLTAEELELVRQSRMNKLSADNRSRTSRATA